VGHGFSEIQHVAQMIQCGFVGMSIHLFNVMVFPQDRDKTIVTMCPHYDRAEIARLFLTLQGYRSRYFTGGILKLVDYLRGDKARDYLNRIGG